MRLLRLHTRAGGEPIFFDRDGVPLTDDVWATRFSDAAYRHVAATAVADAEVITDWWGLEPELYGHPWGRRLREYLRRGAPLIFETHVTGSPLGGYAHRYSTLEAAQNGHARVVGKVRRAQRVRWLQARMRGMRNRWRLLLLGLGGAVLYVLHDTARVYEQLEQRQKSTMERRGDEVT
jgi:hypothetical protein